MSIDNEPVSFNEQIKPLFRERDRQSMKNHFDLLIHDNLNSLGIELLNSRG